MNHRIGLFAIAAAVTGLPGAASAQTLPHRDDPAWEPIGVAADGAQYAILPSRTDQEHTTVWLTMRGSVMPSPDGTPDTIVAQAVVDCRATAIGLGTTDFYNETQGYLGTVEGPADPVPIPATHPGQHLVIQHACAD